MTKLFGTDGVRGIAGQYPMTPEMAMKIGKAVAYLLSPAKLEGQGRGKIIIGKDTRVSGDMIEHALVAGITAMGINPCLTGILPTPGVAYLTRQLKAAAGIVVSASHNPFQDNGIKIFNQEGCKLSENQEQAIEALVLKHQEADLGNGRQSIGTVEPIANMAMDQYISLLTSSLEPGLAFNGLKVVMDCANGAASRIAPRVFQDLGADVDTLFAAPDGMNINQDCGSQHPQYLIQQLKASRAEIGLAFDGDADRLIAVDENGEPTSGDQILAICAQDLQQRGLLKDNMVVSTVMSNMGLGVALKKLGIGHITTQVGDRFVMEAMKKHGAVLGGEDSGHMIFMSHHTTGDGILAAIQLIGVMLRTNKSLSELKKIMDVFPQELVNVTVKEKRELNSIPEIAAVIASVEKELAEQGRVLVRYSGTQSICRVMVEGPTLAQTQDCCQRIAAVLRKCLS